MTKSICQFPSGRFSLRAFFISSFLKSPPTLLLSYGLPFLLLPFLLITPRVPLRAIRQNGLLNGNEETGHWRFRMCSFTLPTFSDLTLSWRWALDAGHGTPHASPQKSQCPHATRIEDRIGLMKLSGQNPDKNKPD